MMDLKNAVLLGFAAYYATDWAKRAIPFTLPPWAVQILAVGVSIGATFLVGATVWAHQQVIGGHTLDTMNAGSKIVVGFLITGVSTGLDRFNLFDSRTQDPPKLGKVAQPVQAPPAAA